MSALSPNSPCIGVCNLSPAGWCQGCYRTMCDITGWLSMDPAARWAVVRAAEARRVAAAPSGVAVQRISTTFGG